MRRKLNKLLSEHALLTRQVEEEKKLLTEAESHVIHVQEAQQILQGLAEGIQNLANTKIAEIVTRCLQAIFGDEYEFRIRFEKKRNRTEATLYLSNSLGQEIDPISSVGGGIIDVLSFAIRLACLTLTRPQRHKLLILDEPFRFVSKTYRPAIRELLKQLSRELDVQIVMVTHSEEFMIGKVIDMESL